MSTGRATIRGALLLVSALSACVPAPDPRTSSAPARVSAAPVSATTLEREVHQLVNRHRSRRGQPALQYDDRVAAAAREHSAAMAERTRPFSHEGLEQRGSAIARYLPYHGLAENVAYDSRVGPTLGSLIVAGWIDSPPHRQNIEGSFDVTGIGIAQGRDGVVYATQLFVRR
ncbi:MAG: CAP domain-containing protein [Gemmatimonadetes bacterium]|nr:CAP domain-containing protein [Gemmatimonadota bacterium]